MMAHLLIHRNFIPAAISNKSSRIITLLYFLLSPLEFFAVKMKIVHFMTQSTEHIKASVLSCFTFSCMRCVFLQHIHKHLCLFCYIHFNSTIFVLFGPNYNKTKPSKFQGAVERKNREMVRLGWVGDRGNTGDTAHTPDSRERNNKAKVNESPKLLLKGVKVV